MIVEIISDFFFLSRLESAWLSFRAAQAKTEARLRKLLSHAIGKLISTKFIRIESQLKSVTAMFLRDFVV